MLTFKNISNLIENNDFDSKGGNLHEFCKDDLTIIVLFNYCSPLEVHIEYQDLRVIANLELIGEVAGHAKKHSFNTLNTISVGETAYLCMANKCEVTYLNKPDNFEELFTIMLMKYGSK